MTPTVMIHCPTTKQPISTGIGMDRTAFGSSRLENNSVSCPVCGQMHMWSKKDAFVLGN